MDSYLDVVEHESSAKRIKLAPGPSDHGELCLGGDFSRFSAPAAGQIDFPEGISSSTDCDSGYEASTMESIPTSSHQTSPQTDSGGDLPDSLSEIFLTPSHTTDVADTSQDSMAEDEEDDLMLLRQHHGNNDNDGDNASTVSEISGLSDLSGQEWKPMAGSMIWIQKQMQSGVNPRTLLTDLGVDLEEIPQFVDEVTLWKLIINMLVEPPRRNKLRHVNTLDDVVRLVRGAQNIIVLTGAGVSVSCGIPDFRSRDGIYSRLAIDFPDLPDPQAMFDINYFNQDPRPFFKFARDIYPGKFKPSPCHNFIRMLERYGKLLRNYTQNIDTLEKVASIEKVIECHGSFATATCTKCGARATAEEIRDTVLAQHIPLCRQCHPERASVSPDDVSSSEIDYRELVASGVMKPDIVFFGEGLPYTFHEAMAEDKSRCDLLLVIGSSLKVRPVALIPSSLPADVPQILINREPLPHCHFDVELLGDCDVIINHLCQLFGGVWNEGVYEQNMLQEVPHLLPLNDTKSSLKSTSPSKTPEATETEPISTILTETQTQHVELESRLENEEKISTKCGSSLDLINVVTTSTEETNTVQKIVVEGENLDFSTCNNRSTISNKTMSIITNDVNLHNLLLKPPNEDEEVSLMNSKERHMSIDSARDSGIGENSNFTADFDSTKYDDTSDSGDDCRLSSNFPPIMASSHEGQSSQVPAHMDGSSKDDDSDAMKGLWQPKIKKSLADRLPPKSFFLVKPSRYIFPGAEVFYDPDEKLDYLEEDLEEEEEEEEEEESSSSFRDSESDESESEQNNSF